MNDYFLQIFLFISGVIVEILVFFLPDENKRRVVKALGILLIAFALLWAGFEWGVRSTSPQQVMPTLTAPIPADTMIPSVTPSNIPPTSPTTPQPIRETLLLQEYANFEAHEFSSEAPIAVLVNLARSGDETERTFILGYDIPAEFQGQGYAGFDMVISPPLNVSEYRTFEFSISFSDAGAGCVVIFEDGNNIKEYPIQGTLVTDAIQNAKVISIPLEYFFGSVNLSNLVKITFEVRGSLSTGQHNYSVSAVKFTK